MNTNQLLCGIELETEGSYMTSAQSKYWSFLEEGTLRGPHIEFVLSEPTLLDELDPALNELGEFVSLYPVRLTSRCGLHVHIDVRQLTREGIYSACLAYTLLENLLYKISGDRSKNKFCVPVSKSSYVRESISRLYSDRNSGRGDKLYSGLNLASISRLGSLEFRMHTGTLCMEELYIWVETLHDLVLRASALDPEDIIQAGQTYRVFHEFVTKTLRLSALEKELQTLEDNWRTYDTKLIEQIHFRALQLANKGDM